MAERGVKEDMVTVTFDVSALEFVAGSFGMKFVDGILKRVKTLDCDDVKCMICGKEMSKHEVGGFFKGEPDIQVCCNDALCLIRATDD